jgi:hypothetical protein
MNEDWVITILAFFSLNFSVYSRSLEVDVRARGAAQLNQAGILNH